MLNTVIACLTIIGLATMIGVVYVKTRAKLPNHRDRLIARLDAVLPQTQCGLCGFGGCRPYAAALATGESDIDQCPPGGVEGMQKLARILVRDAHGRQPKAPQKAQAVARIDEPACIGCTLCIQACPVDAILGAAKQMHAVLERYCTGCELCLRVCPVDCIRMMAPRAEYSPKTRTIPLRLAA